MLNMGSKIYNTAFALMTIFGRNLNVEKFRPLQK